MRRLFDPDSPVMGCLYKVFDAIVLGLLWILCSLPVVTMGAASAALYTATRRCLVHSESYLLRTFFSAFRENWKQATLVWLLVLALLGLLAVDAAVFRSLAAAGTAWGGFYWVILALFCLVLTWSAYLLAYCARCQGTAAEVLRISFQLLMLHPIRALGVLLPLVGGIALALIAPGLIFFLPAPVCWLESRTIEVIFRLHMRPEDLERETA